MRGIKYAFHRVKERPSVIKDVMRDKMYSRKDQKEILQFIAQLKQSSPYYIDPNNNTKLNKLCYIEDWQNTEIKQAFAELPNVSSYHSSLPSGVIHKKNWEWALAIVAMQRFDRLNGDNIAIGIGSGQEAILFYLANRLRHVYATDLYEGKGWEEAPADFPENPHKYAPVTFKEDSLSVLRMDGTRLEFPSEYFDVAFSFSSIEHFGGKNHSGALRSLQEIERVLKRRGIAIIATEYIINDKEHDEFFNRRTIYSDLIDKLEMQLVEPLDLRITTNTLDAVVEFYSAVRWIEGDDNYKMSHPFIIMSRRNILWTSVMLVFQKL